MTEDGYTRIAIRVLAKIKAYDPRVSTEREPINAWAEHLEHHWIRNLDEALDAVREWFDNPRDRPVQPADITGLIRAKRQDAYERRPEPSAYRPLPGGEREFVQASSPEHRAKCMAEIRAILDKQGKRWSVPPL